MIACRLLDYSPCRWLIRFSCMNSTCGFGGVWGFISLSFADFVANERELVLSGGVSIDFSLLFADGEWPCTLEHGNDAGCLADEEYTAIGDSMCFTGLGGRRGRVSSDWQLVEVAHCFFMEIGCDTSRLHSDLPEETSDSQSLTLAADVRPSARRCLL